MWCFKASEPLEKRNMEKARQRNLAFPVRVNLLRRSFAWNSQLIRSSVVYQIEIDQEKLAALPESKSAAEGCFRTSSSMQENP